MSSTVISFGMLIVLLIAPERNGWAAAIILMCPSWWMKRLPFLPLLLAVSKTGRCSSARCGAPSIVCRPQMWSLASLISAVVKPSALSRLNSQPVYSSTPKPRRCSVLLAEREDVEGELSSKTPGSAFSTLAMSSSVEALAVSVSG